MRRALEERWRSFISLVVVNQLLSAALYAPLAREYPFTYREVRGERRWSTRAPLGDWYSHHVTAARAVREEAQAARWLAELDRPATLVVALSPYRLEWEVLARHAPYRYQTEARSGVIWVTLETDGRKVLFVEGDPERTRPVSRRHLRRASCRDTRSTFRAGRSRSRPMPSLRAPSASVRRPQTTLGSRRRRSRDDSAK